MRKTHRLLVMISLVVLAVMASGCTSNLDDRDFGVVSFKGGECLGTKASDSKTTSVKMGTLRLQYSGGNLKTTLSGLQDNCSIKEGFDCNAMIDGTTIYIDVVAKFQESANCICNVSDIVSEVSGLVKGEYTIVYHYESSSLGFTESVTFNFSPILNKKVDVNRTCVYETE